MPQETRSARLDVDPGVSVVAVVVNGATYVLLSTSGGLRWCRDRHIGDPKRWTRTATLHDMIDAVSRARDTVEVYVSTKPNMPRPRLDLKFSTRNGFLKSGLELSTSGTQHVNISRPQRVASTAMSGQ